MSKLGYRLALSGTWKAECYGQAGEKKWEDEFTNLITNEGINHILNTEFHNGTKVYPWYVGLKHAGSANVADTLSSHPGWTECANYSGTRPSFNEAAASGQSITNSASKATFSINTNGQVIAGAFLCSAASGTSGTLFSVGDFSTGNKTLDNGDTLQVTYTLNGVSS